VSAARDVLDLSRAILAAQDGIVAVFKVYIDESGTHDRSPVVTVAAYLARPKQWEAFTKEWRRAIRPIKVYHATDAANCHGAFEGWTPKQVAELAARALPIIPKHVGMAVAVGIQMDDYRMALKERPELAALLGEPYGACLQWALTILLRAKAEHNNREQIVFFHEQNDYKTEAMRVYDYVTERWNVGAVSSFAFGSKEKYVPLQAADIYAYEANKRLRDPTTPSRRALDALVPDKSRAVLRYFNSENMAELTGRLAEASKMTSTQLASWAWLSGIEASETMRARKA
jgi:Protein of unknown function (DUF3800)